MKKIYAIGALACVFAGCKPSVNITKPLSAGDAVFTNYLAIGNSLTAGYADNTLTVSGQYNSYPQRLFEQFQLVGAKGPFVQPLLTGNYGYPTAKLMLQNVTHCDGSVSLGPVPYSGPLDSNGSWHFTSTVNNGQINNIGVPGIRIADYPVANYATIAAALGAPYALRFYNDPAKSPLEELKYRVNNLHPTFFTMWLGANDVLMYATKGGQGDGTGNAIPIGLGLYASDAITPTAVFQTNYDSALNVAISTGASGALINIPDITALPFFTTVPYNGLTLTRQGQVDSLKALYAGEAWNKVFQLGSNAFVIKDHAGLTRQIVPGELILLTVPLDSLTCAGWGSVKPIPREYVLTTDEIQYVRNATNTFNSFIELEAARHHLAYVDMKTYMSTFASGFSYNGIKYTTQYVSGGAFSLDGVHLTPRGYALVANQIITTINTFYHSLIPLTDVNKYPGVAFP